MNEVVRKHQATARHNLGGVRHGYVPTMRVRLRSGVSALVLMSLGLWTEPVQALDLGNGTGTGTAHVAISDPAGNLATANGLSAVAIGAQSTASGFESSALGARSTASGISSSAYGAQSTASGNGSSAYGLVSQATGASSSAYGSQSKASGGGSSAYGMLSQATGESSSAYGVQSTASGGASSAYGVLSQATGEFSSAYGAQSKASGNDSSAYGVLSQATGAFSSAYGGQSAASGEGATAVGWSASAGFANSAAFGIGATATRVNQQVFGTAANTYTMPGITSAASQAAQIVPTHIVTSNAAGDLAAHTPAQLGLASQTDINRLRRRDKQLTEGIAIAMALAQPMFQPGQKFAMRMGGGHFDGSNALGLTMAGVLNRGWSSPTSSITLDGGLGVGIGQRQMGGRIGVTFGW